MNTLFPIFIKIDQIHTLLVGGGFVGTEKLEALLKNNIDARVTVVAEYLSPEIQELAEQASRVTLIKRRFLYDDLRGKDMVILATDSRKLHEKIVKVTKNRGILTNVADTPDLCDFYLGSVVRKGDLKIAISTNGKSPTLAKRIREYLEDYLPENLDELAMNLGKFRDTLKGDFSYKVKMLNDLTQQIFSRKVG